MYRDKFIKKAEESGWEVTVTDIEGGLKIEATNSGFTHPNFYADIEFDATDWNSVREYLRELYNDFDVTEETRTWLTTDADFAQDAAVLVDCLKDQEEYYKDLADAIRDVMLEVDRAA